MHLSLRLKLALISLLLLAIPYTGIRLAEIVQVNLLESRKVALMFSARAVATSLSGRDGLFDRELFHSLKEGRDLYLYQLQNPMRLNGKFDDWSSYLDNAEFFNREHLLFSEGEFDSASSGFHHIIGKRSKYIYALFQVRDELVVYRKRNSLSLHKSDHLQIGLEDRNGILHRYIVATTKPGWVNGFLLSSNPDNMVPLKNETRIQGVWEDTDDGYTIELRIPLELVGNKLAFSITDVDDVDQRTVKSIIGTANTEQQDSMGWLLSPSITIKNILKTLNRPQSRIVIVDSNQHLRASYGSLDEQGNGQKELQSSLVSVMKKISAPVQFFFKKPQQTEQGTTSAQPTTINIKGVQSALLGNSSVSTYHIENGKTEIMAAIEPLRENDQIIGAVIVEQTTSTILALKNRVLEESLALTLLVLFFGGFGLLLFAFRISSRIRMLRNQANDSIGKGGQILTVPTPSRARDEIGDLSRTLHNVLSQLQAQGQYREKMADNLEHEMRTPLAGASASLKNLARELDDQPPGVVKYVQWALGDIERMEGLLSAIRDATNLKDALEQGFTEQFNLPEAIKMWLQYGWQPAYADVEFTFACRDKEIPMDGDPDKIRQMLDKIIDNSVSFHKNGSPIELTLSKKTNGIQISIFNQGPHIPENMHEDIFNSMVSSRQKQGTTPHLGLGLHIARTIAEHHGGNIYATNINEPNEGVCFTIHLINPTKE